MHRDLLLVLLLAGCGRELSPSDIKEVGVGLNPDEIGPEADLYGGVVEYDWVNFAGGQLPLALTGLVSYDPVGPSLNQFAPPYALIYGVGFVMDQDLPAPDALLGTFAAPPKTVGTCQTVYEPSSFINGLADVGNTLDFKSDDGSSGVSFNRTPEVYPPDARDVFSYYFGIETWRPTAQTRWALGTDSHDPTTMTSEVIRPGNFDFGKTMTMSFAGGAPPPTAVVGSIPMPLATNGSDHTITLPNQPQGVYLSWSGPRYDQDGLTSGDPGENSTCLNYIKPATTPAGPDDCLTQETQGAPQMYTGPWDTDGGVLFKWKPPEQDANETVSITVRFLGKVDRQSEYLLEGLHGDEVDGADASVYDADTETWSSLADTWSALQADGTIPSSAALPRGRTPALTCDQDDDVTWAFDDAYLQADGSYVPSLQGDPSTTLVEVTCTVPETAGDSEGEFLLTEDQLSDAMAYAQLHGGEGAIFYFTRSTSAAITTPPVRDSHGKRRDIEPVLVVSRAVELGRFWYGQ